MGQGDSRWVVRRLGAGRGQIMIQGLRFGERTAPDAHCQNAHHPYLVALGKGQHIPLCHGVTGLGTMCAIQPQVTFGNHVCGGRATFEEARLPQPFVQPKFRLGSQI